jgi:plastocyanin
MKKWLIYATLIASVAFARSANASETTVHIMNRDPKTNISFLYSPGVVRVAPGVTVNWVSTNTMHNVSFVDLTGSFCTKRNVRTRFGREFLSWRRRGLVLSRS